MQSPNYRNVASLIFLTFFIIIYIITMYIVEVNYLCNNVLIVFTNLLIVILYDNP